MQAMAHTIHPARVLIFLKFMGSNYWLQIGLLLFKCDLALAVDICSFVEDDVDIPGGSFFARDPLDRPAIFLAVVAEYFCGDIWSMSLSKIR